MSFAIGQNVVILPANPDHASTPGVIVSKRDLRNVTFFLVRYFSSVSEVEKWFTASELSAE